jgi:hypothetical protein
VSTTASDSNDRLSGHREGGTNVVVKLGAGEIESALRQANAWSAYGGDRSTWVKWLGSASKLDRNRMIGALGRAAVTKALGGRTPSWVHVHSTERTDNEVVVRDSDADDKAVVQVRVVIAHPIEDSTFTVIGWALARDRNLGTLHDDWDKGPPAWGLPPRDMAELRAAIRERAQR